MAVDLVEREYYAGISVAIQIAKPSSQPASRGNKL
jgi:hypothetical protein